MAARKVKKLNKTRTLADPGRKPTYHEGGRAPLTDRKLVPITVAIESSLYDEVTALSERFINPSTKKPYGVSSVVRIIVEFGLKELDDFTDDDLLYYNAGKEAPKGAVGRWPLSESGQSYKMSVLISHDHITKINSRITAKMAKIVGTTTVLRYLLREYIGSMSEAELYASIPESHKQIMRKEKLTPRILIAYYNANK